MSSESIWYLTRSSALVSWVLLVAAVVWGAAASGRMIERRGARRWLVDTHSTLGALGIALAVLHIVTAIADSYVGLHWIDAIVPGAASWEPWAMSLGVIAVWSLAIVQLTSRLRHRIPRRVWHGAHMLSYVACWTMSLHAVLVGTDLTNRTLAFSAFMLVVVASAVSFERARTAHARATRAAVRS